jgi:hypothetical protein
MFLLKLGRPSSAGRVLAYDSGSSAKLMRLLGVETRARGGRGGCPSQSVAPLRTLLTISGMNVVGVGEGDLEGVQKGWGSGSLAEVGVADVEELFLECFIALCLGGEGARVEDECVPFVKSLEIDAVAFDVLASGSGAGVLGMNLGAFSLSPLSPSAAVRATGGGWSSRIFRRLWTVRLAMQPSDDEEDSSTGGVMSRCGIAMWWVCSRGSGGMEKSMKIVDWSGFL